MCGIVGVRHDYLHQCGLDPHRTLQRATKAMAWRGPDGQAFARCGGWWLGCARLAISGPTSRQPVARRGGRHLGVLNGALVNARHLFDELLPGVAKRQHTPNDAWLPLLATERGQAHMLTKLRGHYAYAVAAADGSLVIGQDRHAEKPLLCLFDRLADSRGKHGPWRLAAFASTAAALHEVSMPDANSLPSSERHRTGNSADRRLAEWLRYGWDIEKPHRIDARLVMASLPARGQPIEIQASGELLRPRLTHGEAPPARASGSDHASESRPLRDRLREAVRMCLDTPSRAALSLSGGIDSSCLALLAGELARASGSPAPSDRPPAYQFRARMLVDRSQAACQEREAAAAVARKAGLELHPVDAGPEVLDALPALTAAAKQPLGDPSVLAVHAVARAAHRDGCRVLLGGEGADERLLGYRRYRIAESLGRWRGLARIVARLPLARTKPDWAMHASARLRRASRADNPIRSLLAVAPPAFADLVLAPHLGHRACWHDREPMPPRPGNAVDALRSRADDLAHYLPRDLLAKQDVATLAAGVEGRCPYLVADLSPFGATKRALGKRELREAFAHDLPEAVQKLPKFGFALPLDDWFRGDTAALAMLREPQSGARQHLRPGGLERALEVHRQGKANLGHALYLLYALEVFLRQPQHGGSPGEAWATA
ncbi:MAG: asparagine synthase-related protein [Planctomycetota bacterium]